MTLISDGLIFGHLYIVSNGNDKWFQSLAKHIQWQWHCCTWTRAKNGKTVEKYVPWSRCSVFHHNPPHLICTRVAKSITVKGFIRLTMIQKETFSDIDIPMPSTHSAEENGFRWKIAERKFLKPNWLANLCHLLHCLAVSVEGSVTGQTVFTYSVRKLRTQQTEQAGINEVEM